jgi:hypothetical protein
MDHGRTPPSSSRPNELLGMVAVIALGECDDPVLKALQTALQANEIRLRRGGYDAAIAATITDISSASPSIAHGMQ